MAKKPIKFGSGGVGPSWGGTPSAPAKKTTSAKSKTVAKSAIPSPRFMNSFQGSSTFKPPPQLDLRRGTVVGVDPIYNPNNDQSGFFQAGMAMRNRNMVGPPKPVASTKPTPSSVTRSAYSSTTAAPTSTARATTARPVSTSTNRATAARLTPVATPPVATPPRAPGRGMKSGGAVSGRADGCCSKGKTRGKMV